MTAGYERSKSDLIEYAKKLELTLLAYLCQKQRERDVTEADPSMRAALVITEAELQTARGKLEWNRSYTSDGHLCITVSLAQPAEAQQHAEPRELEAGSETIGVSIGEPGEQG